MPTTTNLMPPRVIAQDPALKEATYQLVVLVLDEDLPVVAAASALLEHADEHVLHQVRARVQVALDLGPSRIADRASAIVEQALEQLGLVA